MFTVANSKNLNYCYYDVSKSRTIFKSPSPSTYRNTFTLMAADLFRCAWLDVIEDP